MRYAASGVSNGYGRPLPGRPCVLELQTTQGSVVSDSDFESDRLRGRNSVEGSGLETELLDGIDGVAAGDGVGCTEQVQISGLT